MAGEQGVSLSRVVRQRRVDTHRAPPSKNELMCAGFSLLLRKRTGVRTRTTLSAGPAALINPGGNDHREGRPSA